MADTDPQSAFCHLFFPHLIDSIAAADPAVRWKLRSTCSYLYKRLRPSFYHVAVHVHGAEPGDSPSALLAISTSDGEVRNLGRHGPTEWERVAHEKDQNGMTWGDKFADTRVVDLAPPGLDTANFRYVLQNNTMSDYLLKPRMLRAIHGAGTVPNIRTSDTFVIVFDASKGGHIHYQWSSLEAVGASKLVVAIHYRPDEPVLPLNNPPREASHIVFHFTPLKAVRDLPVSQQLYSIMRVLGHRGLRMFGLLLPCIIDFVGFDAIRCRNLQGDADHISQHWWATLSPQYNMKRPVFNFLTLDEYMRKYNLSAATVALEKGHNFSATTTSL